MTQSRSAARRRRDPLFLGTGAAEEVLNRVVSLVALDAEHRDIGGPERPLGRPRSRPGVGIVNGYTIPERLGVDAREALDDVQAFARPEVARVAAEVRRVHDEGLTLVAANRVPEPAADRRRQVRAVQPDDAGIDRKSTRLNSSHLGIS